MRVLVTGGAGFIGSHTVDALLGKGHDVRILDNLQKPVHLKGKPGWVHKDAEFILGDVRNRSDWEKALRGIDAVYHFAAYQDYLPDFSTFFHVNAVSTALMYEVAVEKRMELSKVVVASSQFVQGEGVYKCPSAECADYEEWKDINQTSKGTGKVNSDSLLVECDENSRLSRANEQIGNIQSATQRISNCESNNYNTKQCRMFPGMMRGEAQLKKGQWEMRCPVCGGSGEWQWTPETYTKPPNAYAMAKYSQEMQTITFGNRYQIPSVALRYSIVQGPRQSFYNAYSGACRIFSLAYYFGKAPTLYEDGQQRRDFVNIHDVVRANMMALEDERMNGDVYNVGGGRAYTVEELADIVRNEVQKRSKSPLPDPVKPGLYRFGDTRNACSDISKLKALGWRPEIKPAESAREYVAWLYEQDNVEDILSYAEKTMKNMNVVRSVG